MRIFSAVFGTLLLAACSNGQEPAAKSADRIAAADGGDFTEVDVADGVIALRVASDTYLIPQALITNAR